MNNDFEKDLISQLYEEDKVNRLLLNFDYKKPNSILDIYIREQFKDDQELYKSNHSFHNKTKVYKEKYKIHLENYKKLTSGEKTKYINIYKQEKLEFARNLEIIKKYIFKGADGNIKLKQTAYQLYFSDELINGIEKGYDINIIKKEASIKWDRMDLNTKQKFYNKNEEIHNILHISQNYKYINSFLVFIHHHLYKKNLKIIPSIYELAKLFNELSHEKKSIYENYSNEFIFLRYKLRDIYDAIHGIISKSPAGALRIFLQEKAINNEISSIKEGKILWNQLSLDEKEKYLNKCHLQFLAYKYKESLFNNKINRFLPKKPNDRFTFFTSQKKGLYIPKGVNTMEHLRESYNNLSFEDKNKLDNDYNKQLNNYNNKIKFFNKIKLDFPKKPKSAFAFFVKEKINLYSWNNSVINNEYIKNIINIIFKEWIEGNFDKKSYLLNAEKDKKRFEKEVEEFDNFGYYTLTLE